MARTRDGFTDMDWDKLKVFHAAAEAGSFTHAGEQLGLSQSAVSRQVSALEQELGVSLFHRHARGLILTEQGELLHHTAHDVFMKLEAARTKLSDSREKPNGEIKVQTTIGVGAHWLTPRLGEFFDLYPGQPGQDAQALLVRQPQPKLWISDLSLPVHRFRGHLPPPKLADCSLHPSQQMNPVRNMADRHLLDRLVRCAQRSHVRFRCAV